MEINGTIKKIFETQTFSSGFRKRELVLTTQEQYPQDLLVEFLQDKIDLLNPLNEGDAIKISINLRGREWINPEGVAKYFNSISGWRIEKMQEQTTDMGQIPPMPPISESSYQQTAKTEDEDDLPF